MIEKVLPKVVGVETEYAVVMTDNERLPVTRNRSARATQLMLRHCREFPAPYGWEKDFLINGARLYQDHTHIEYSTPEALSALTAVAAVKAGDVIVNRARLEANAFLGDRSRIHVFANNSDGWGNSYAGHVNILLSRDCFSRLFDRRPHSLYLYWVPHLVSSQIYTGAGKLGRENSGSREISYQISQRADFIETAVIGEQTTYHRPLLNARDEALADPLRFARLHIITFDTNMAEQALFLKIGTSQLVLAMLEAEFGLPVLTIKEPVTSMKRISLDPTLKERVVLEDGRELTALEIQEEILGAASRFVSQGRSGGIVPGAERIVELWACTLDALRNSPGELFGRVDWITKLELLSHSRRTRGSLDWMSLKVVDHQYHNIDPAQGLSYTAIRGEDTDHVISEGDVLRLTEHAPEDTRAYFRSECLRRFGNHLHRAEWEKLEFHKEDGCWRPMYARLNLDDPLGFTRDKVEGLLEGISTVSELFELFNGDGATFTTKNECRSTAGVAYRGKEENDECRKRCGAETASSKEMERARGSEWGATE
jgi:hypothetical protein